MVEFTPPAHLDLTNTEEQLLMLGPNDPNWLTPDYIVQILADPEIFDRAPAERVLALARDSVLLASLLLKRG